MSSESASNIDRKRKRSQKGKDGPTSRKKRQKAEDGIVVSSDEGEDGEDITANVENDGTGSPAANTTTSQPTPIRSSVPSIDDTAATPSSTKAKNRRRRPAARTRNGELAEGRSEVGKVAERKTPEWHLASPTGGRLIRQDPLFSIDEKHLLSATAGTLNVMSIEDSLVESSISLSDGAEISAFALSQGNPSQIYIGSNAGRVESWNWMTKSRSEILASGLGQIDSIRVYTDMETEEDTLYTLATADGMSHLFVENTRIYSSSTTLAHFDVQTDHVLAIASGKLIVGKRLTDGQYQFMEYRIAANITSLAARIQSVQATQKKGKKTPQDSLVVALGSDSGEIYLYEDVSIRGNDAAPALATPRTLHWHREAVEALKWSRDGNYLISGGRETVLVLWQLVTGKKQFLPHLSAEIEQITVSPKGSSYAVQLADNSVMVISTTELRPTAHFAGMQAQFPKADMLAAQEIAWMTKGGKRGVRDDTLPSSNPFNVAGVLHPQYKDRIILTVPPSLLQGKQQYQYTPRPFLQTYDIAAGRHISRQAITRNKITDFNSGPDGNKIEEPDASLLQISHDGQWLATIETWTPPAKDTEFLASSHDLNQEQRNLRQEVYLKIWHWIEQKKLWALQTRIENPHPSPNDTTPCRVLELIADPTEVGFASIGEDGCVRVWAPKAVTNRGRQIVEEVAEWRCRHVAQLEQGWEMEELSSSGPIASRASLSYSADGSLIAVSQPTKSGSLIPSIHFVHSDTGRLLQSRSGLFTGDLCTLSFLGHHLVILSTTELAVWDIVTETQTYRLDMARPDPSLPIASRPRLLTVNEQDSTFAIALPSKTTTNQPSTTIRVFKPTNHKDVFTEQIPHIVTAMLTSPNQKSYTLLTSSASIIQLQPSTSGAALQALKRLPSTSIPVAASTTAPSVDEDMTDANVDGEEVATMAEELDLQPDNERPVVRPEQLAGILDGASAGSNVRTMFEAVVGLFGRKVEGVSANA